ncbi:hypothetical protein OS493_037849 [Desmophyllum pertusum]|uniref:Uncharacterized protein n=1 Tax=Desmophyllum pertusum TaxID=174260 RepID=A0A9W9ZV23_9CNID|nr:hypothetical protein OS493_037849 [Desmophyllum pertusum]
MPAVMWAVGINQEKHQKLVYLCQKKILSRGAVFFNNESIYQILNGCANLHMTSTELFPKFQEAILNGEVKICDFEDHQLSGISLSFAKTDNGSVELFDALLEEILSRDFSMIECRALAEFVWAFAKNQLIADELFDRIEEEILRRGIPYLDKTDFIQILWAYGMTGKGSKQLFYSVDNELVSRGVERHDDKLVTEIESELSSRNGRQIGNTHLCQVAWSLGRAGKSDSKMFDVTEAEVFRRGVFEFSKEEKFMLMRAFLEAKRGSKEFYELLYSSFSANDLSNFSARDIHEFAWCVSEADVEAGAVFDALEKEILKKEKYHFSEKQLTSIKKSFQKVGKGSKELFEF